MKFRLIEYSKGPVEIGQIRRVRYDGKIFIVEIIGQWNQITSYGNDWWEIRVIRGPYWVGDTTVFKEKTHILDV